MKTAAVVDGLPDSTWSELLAKFRIYRQTRAAVLRDQLICENMPLVHSIARRYRNIGEPVEDLILEGSIGLMHAVDHFDPDRGIRFSTYATHLVISQIQHYLRDCGHLIRQPAWVQELNARVTRAASQLTQELGREPAPDEIAEFLNLTEGSVQEVLAARELQRVVSLTALTQQHADDELLLIDREKIRAKRQQTLRLPIEDRITLEEAIDSLKTLERKVVRLFFSATSTRRRLPASWASPRIIPPTCCGNRCKRFAPRWMSPRRRRLPRRR